MVARHIEAERAENGGLTKIGRLEVELQEQRAENEQLRAENERLRGKPKLLPPPEAFEQPVDGEIIAPAPQAAPPKPVPPQACSGDEAKARAARVNSDRSAYQQQGLRPPGGEPWRPFVGGGNEDFFWGGATGRRAW